MSKEIPWFDLNSFLPHFCPGYGWALSFSNIIEDFTVFRGAETSPGQPVPSGPLSWLARLVSTGTDVENLCSSCLCIMSPNVYHLQVDGFEKSHPFVRKWQTFVSFFCFFCIILDPQGKSTWQDLNSHSLSKTSGSQGAQVYLFRETLGQRGGNLHLRAGRLGTKDVGSKVKNLLVSPDT